MKVKPIGFLNVDLEIKSSKPLDSLAEEMGASVFVLHSGLGNDTPHLLCLESSGDPNTADAAARALCSAVEQLSPRGRKLWDRAKRKTFDVGYELPPDARNIRVVLERAMLKRILGLGATVAFTCYPGDDMQFPAEACSQGEKNG